MVNQTNGTFFDGTNYNYEMLNQRSSSNSNNQMTVDTHFRKKPKAGSRKWCKNSIFVKKSMFVKKIHFHQKFRTEIITDSHHKKPKPSLFSTKNQNPPPGFNPRNSKSKLRHEIVSVGTTDLDKNMHKSVFKKKKK